MSMNLSEFKKILGADPWNRDSETLRARNAEPEFERVAEDAESFERKLQSALNVHPPADLLGKIQGISKQPSETSNTWMTLALAASVLIAIGAAGVVWKQLDRLEQVETYLAEHYALDGKVTISQAAGAIPEQKIREIMTSLGVTAGPQLAERIRIIKYCPTPVGRGAHMVINTDEGMVTIIYMPDTQVQDGELIEFDQMQAYLVSLDRGSAAIIGSSSQPIENLEAMVRSSIKSGLLDA